jgi:hypothetical protein
MRRIAASAALMLVLVAAGCSSGAKLPSDDPSQVYGGTVTVVDGDDGPELCGGFMESSTASVCSSSLRLVGWDWDKVEGEEALFGRPRSGSWHVEGTYSRDALTVMRVEPALGDSDRGGFSLAPHFGQACEHPDVVDASQGGDAYRGLTPDGHQRGGVDDTKVPDLVADWVTNPSHDGKRPFIGNMIVRPGGKERALGIVRDAYLGPMCVIERDLPTRAQLRRVEHEVYDDAARKGLGVVAYSEDQAKRGVVAVNLYVVDRAAYDYARDRWGDLVELYSLLQPVE